MKYFRNEKMEGMTVRSYSLTKIIAFALGILVGLTTPKEDRKVLSGVALIGLLLAGLVALSEVVTCTLQIGFSSDDEDEYDWGDEADSDDFLDDWQEET